MGKRIIIAGGGTGGHIFPAIAIANALKKLQPDLEILFVGAKGKMEMQKVPEAGYQIRGIDIAGFNRSSLIKNIGLPFKLIKSYFQVKDIMGRFMPDVVVGVGGYSSFPVLRYAQAKTIPSFIHESNSYAGKSNIMLGKKATRIFVAHEGMEKFFPAGRITLTGNPVRSNIVDQSIGREAALKSFGLDPGKKTVFVTGGSLGARGINEAVLAGLDEFEKSGIQLIWQTGSAFGQVAKQACVSKQNIWTGEFIARMDIAFAAADVVVSRSGAMAIAELSVVGKPVIFVPFPFAAEDHQTANAKNLVSHNAAILVTDQQAKDKLVSTAIQLAHDQGKQGELISNIRKMAVTNADEVIAREILKQIND